MGIDDYYGDACIVLLYDVDAVVKQSNSSGQMRRLHGIKPEKFMFVPSNERSKGGLCIGDRERGISWRTRATFKGRDGNDYPDPMRLSEAKLGSRYPISLVHSIADVATELGKQGIHTENMQASNSVKFKPGELEKRIADAKKEFSRILASEGLTVNQAQIYFELEGSVR